MAKYLKKNLSFISFILIPIVFLWDPNWLGFIGVKPYWPLFWLLPWSMIHGSTYGLFMGFSLGLILDSISLDSSFSQIPGLVLCGLWFGKLSISSNVFIGHFKYGLICLIASLFCGFLYFVQILINNLSDNSIFFYVPSIKNLFAQVFITALLAPFFCSRLFRLFSRSKERKIMIDIKNK